MIRLKDRNRQIPFGLFYRLPQTNWRSRAGSFENICQQLIANLKGNPAAAKQLKLDPENVESIRNAVDYFNARVCQANGWNEYFVDTGGSAPPKTSARPINAQLGAVAAGVNTLKDWLGAGGLPVSSELSNHRASVCVGCPLNTANNKAEYSGDWTTYFTRPAATFIQKQFEKRAEMNLKTALDEMLSVCIACLCPLQLKVHCPIEHIQARMPDFVREELKNGKECWVLKEIG